MLKRLLTGIAAFFLGGCAADTSGEKAAMPAATLAIVGGLLVDPESAAPPAEATILISGDTIIAVGEGLRPPPGAAIVPARGRYLVPGLWDMHAHLAAVEPTGMAPERYVGHGVLAVRDMGGHPKPLFALRRAIEAGERIGPRLILAGPTLNGEASAPFHRLVRNDAEARQAVRELKAAGSDFIKIHRRTGKEAFFAIADESRVLGLRFAGHVPLVLDWVTAADAGMATMEHIQALAENQPVERSDPVAAIFVTVEQLNGARGDAIIAAMARNGSAFDPTLVFYENSWAADPPARRALKQKFYRQLRPFVLRAQRRGVPILAGSDLMTRHGDMLLIELERLVETGLSTREALAAATSAPRRLVGRGPGRIAAGEEASLLIVDADPREDIRNLRRMSGAVLRGRMLDAAALAGLRTTTD